MLFIPNIINFPPDIEIFFNLFNEKCLLGEEIDHLSNKHAPPAGVNPGIYFS